MSKNRRTVSIEQEVDEFLSKDGVNASQLVNKLVKNHATSGGDKRSMLELRKEQIQSDINELEGRLDQKQEELERVNDQLSNFQTGAEKVLDEAVTELEGTPLEENNPAIQNWAQEAGLSVTEFIERLDERRD